MFLILGQVVKDRVTDSVNRSKFFGCLVDEVTDVSILQQFVTFVKVSANPKLTVLHNFGFLYDSINRRNSFRLKKIHQKMLFVQEVI